MSEKRTERKRQKYLAHLTTIAEAFLKARAVYPPDYEGFLRVAGQKEVDTFYQTMLLVEQGAQKYGFCFDWFYDQSAKEWLYMFTNEREEKK